MRDSIYNEPKKIKTKIEKFQNNIYPKYFLDVDGFKNIKKQEKKI